MPAFTLLAPGHVARFFDAGTLVWTLFFVQLLAGTNQPFWGLFATHALFTGSCLGGPFNTRSALVRSVSLSLTSLHRFFRILFS